MDSSARIHGGIRDAVAGAFAFLASEGAAFFAGETLVIDGGQLAYRGRAVSAHYDRVRGW